MELRQGGSEGRVGGRRGIACAAVVLAIGGLSTAAQGGSDSSQREVPRPTLGERNLIELGRRLFFEPSLSREGKNACASCHEPEHGFGDTRRFSPEDVGRTRRHSQSLIDVDLKAPQHWDGEFLSVAAIVESRTTEPGTPEGYGSSRSEPTLRRAPRPNAEPVFTVDFGDDEALSSEVSPELDLGLPQGPKVESVRFRTRTLRLPEPNFGNPETPVAEEDSRADGAARVVAHERYAEAIAALPSEKKTARLDAKSAGKAIEAYVGSLRSNRSAYDRFRAGEAEALTASAKRGLELFRGRAGCVACHKEEGPKDWSLFRDGDFHNNGIAWQSDRVALQVPTGGAEGPVVSPGPMLDEGQGRFLPEGAGQRTFKTPSLRDVARHPPYMHDGSKASLEAVVAHYASGCGDDPARDERLKGFEASKQDRDDLVAFLTSLTSEERPGQATEAWAKRAERTRIKFLDAQGEPVVGFEVGLEVAGDSVPTKRAVTLPPKVETDARGEISYVVPGSTHVRLRLPRGLEPDGGSLVPDTCRTATIVLPLSGMVRLALVVEDPKLATPDTLRAYEPIDPNVFDSVPPPTFRPTPWTLSRKGTVQVGEQRAVLYEGYRLGAGHRSLVFRLPGQLAPQQVALGGEDATGSAAATQRVEVTREGSAEWRERAQQAAHVPAR